MLNFASSSEPVSSATASTLPACRPSRPAAARRGVTVVFATRNRAAILVQVLECFTGLIAPEDGWKLVVVDNGSTDGTSGLLRTYAERLPLVVLFEPNAGKNRALNTALPQLENTLIILTDDDVLPRPDWLVRMRQAALDHPEACLFGGTVLPHWSDARPAWLTEDAVPFSVLYAKQTREAGPCTCDAIFGPNMAVCSTVFAAGHQFSETIGPDQSRAMYAMGGETEFLRRVEAAGYQSWFVPEAVVGHIIRPEQLAEAWILQRAYRYGIGEGSRYVARGTTRNDPPNGRLIQLPLRLRGLVYAAAAWLMQLLAPCPLRLKIRYRARVIAGTVDGLAALVPPHGP